MYESKLGAERNDRSKEDRSVIYRYEMSEIFFLTRELID
jgi:hypothetical protein